MEWTYRDLAPNLRSHAGKQSGLGVGPKFGSGSEKQPEDWCDSGLDSLISTEFISIDAPEEPVRIQVRTAEPPEPTDPWGSVHCAGALDGTETERLDSAIGDSINDETVRSLSERIGTVILSEPNPATTHQPGPETQDRRREEIFNTLSFISEDGDT